jgi:hypothetical protein
MNCGLFHVKHCICPDGQLSKFRNIVDCNKRIYETILIERFEKEGNLAALAHASPKLGFLFQDACASFKRGYA